MAPSVRIAETRDLPTIFDVDDDASQLFVSAGFVLELPSHHPYVVAERAQWTASVERGDTFVAVDDHDAPIGFASLALVDGEPYLDQLSVRCSAMRGGIGSVLLERALAWAAARAKVLWLNTYGHLAWNRPFYERRGFALVPEHAWRPAMRAIVAEQRVVLPHPGERVVMRKST